MTISKPCSIQWGTSSEVDPLEELGEVGDSDIGTSLKKCEYPGLSRLSENMDVVNMQNDIPYVSDECPLTLDVMKQKERTHIMSR
jgi:hypothetical protein